MRKIILAIFTVVVFLVVALAAMLSIPALTEPAATPLDRSPELTTLARFVPPAADRVVFVHSLAALYRTLRRSDVAGDLVASLPNESQLHLATLLLGNAEAVFWFDENDAPHGAIRASAFRRGIATLVSRLGGIALHSENGILYYDAEGSTVDPALPAAIASIAGDLPGSLFLYDRKEKTDRFPQIGRPAVTAMSLHFDVIDVRARALRTSTPPAVRSAAFELPKNAALSVVFHGDSAALSDLDRILPIDLSALSADGVLLSLYGVESGRLLPRPRGVIVVADSDAAREAVGSLLSASAFPAAGGVVTSRTIGAVRVDRVDRLGVALEVARVNGRIVIGLDPASLDRYFKEERAAVAAEPGEVWIAHGDIPQLTAIASGLSDQPALKLLAPKIARRAKETSRLLARMHGGETVTATRRVTDGREELDMRIGLAK